MRRVYNCCLFVQMWLGCELYNHCKREESFNCSLKFYVRSSLKQIVLKNVYSANQNIKREFWEN